MPNEETASEVLEALQRLSERGTVRLTIQPYCKRIWVECRVPNDGPALVTQLPAFPHQRDPEKLAKLAALCSMTKPHEFRADSFEEFCTEIVRLSKMT